jgi:hypothetical protein
MYVVVAEPVVYHFGLLPDGLVFRRGVWTYEGDALSVSLCPEDWWSRPGLSMAGAQLYEIFRADEQPARFVDLARLSEANLSAIDDWAGVEGYGSIADPDLPALARAHGVEPGGQWKSLAVKLAWAKSTAVDGVWFSEPITAAAPLSSRGGVFQHRLEDFRCRTLGDCSALAWPLARAPRIELLPLVAGGVCAASSEEH